MAVTRPSHLEVSLEEEAVDHLSTWEAARGPTGMVDRVAAPAYTSVCRVLVGLEVLELLDKEMLEVVRDLPSLLSALPPTA